MAALVLASGLSAGGVWAEEEEEAADPTRGQWDAFLDPVRDAEDRVSEGQKWLEDRSKIHLGAGIVKGLFHDFNDPESDLITLHSLDPDHASPELDFAQIFGSRPSEGWFVPGFATKLGFGRAAKRYKADWDGDGVVKVGDSFEKNSFEVQEAYLTWAVPEDSPVLKGLNFKAGKFVTLLGAEVIEPWLNYNHSRSFLFGFAIPFTHTGALANYPISDKLSVTAGPVVGWDNVDDNNRSPSFMGNLTYVVNDQVTLSANGIYGPEQTGKIGPKRGVADFVATITPVDKLTLLLNYDWGHEDELTASGGAATWQGFAAVSNYDFTDRFSAAFRGEWFEDDEGARTGLRQKLWETTVTAKYLVTQHFCVRAEYRHDESDRGHVFEAGKTKATPGQDIFGGSFTYLFN
jgi:hypothetical protein